MSNAIYLHPNLTNNDLPRLHAEINQIKGYMVAVSEKHGLQYGEAFASFDKLVECINDKLDGSEILVGMK
jgi:hypothetical protein